MSNVPDGYGTSVWNAVTDALETTLVNAPQGLHFGLAVLPSEGVVLACEGDCCALSSDGPLLIAPSANDSARASIPARMAGISPGGGTPVAAALAGVARYLESDTALAQRFVILVLDGGANCNEETECERADCTMHIDGSCQDEPDEGINCCSGGPTGCVDDASVLERLDDLANLGVPTVVVGVPGSELYEPNLNEFALAGGLPNPESGADGTLYYRVSRAAGPGALATTFAAVFERLAYE